MPCPCLGSPRQGGPCDTHLELFAADVAARQQVRLQLDVRRVQVPAETHLQVEHLVAARTRPPLGGPVGAPLVVVQAGQLDVGAAAGGARVPVAHRGRQSEPHTSAAAGERCHASSTHHLPGISAQ